MNQTQEYVTRKVKEKQDRLSSIRQEMIKLEMEISIYTDIIENGDKPTQIIGNDEAIYENEGRRMSEMWKDIFRRMHGPEPTNMDQIRVVAKKVNPDINDDTLRSQLSVYTNRGLLERTATGFYRLTSTGLRAVSR